MYKYQSQRKYSRLYNDSPTRCDHKLKKFSIDPRAAAKSWKQILGQDVKSMDRLVVITNLNDKKKDHDYIIIAQRAGPEN